MIRNTDLRWVRENIGRKWDMFENWFQQGSIKNTSFCESVGNNSNIG